MFRWFLTIQDAIEASESGDSVLVSPGLYQESINFEGKQLLFHQCILSVVIRS